VEINRTAFDAVVAHARDALPDECCGLLIGQRSKVDVIVRARNLDQSPTQFQIDPLDHFAAIRQARMRGQQVIGVYHPHPLGPETPSERDLREATYAEYVYLIVTPGVPVVRAFRLADGNFSALPLVPVP